MDMIRKNEGNEKKRDRSDGKKKKKREEGANRLLETAAPFIADLLKALGGNHQYVIILSDSKGYIYETYGSEEIKEEAGRINLRAGVCMSEKEAGKNAIGTAIKEERPVIIRGEEHLQESFHGWTCSASPVYDENNRIIGTLCLASEKKRFSSHVLSLVIAASKAIENKIHNSSIHKQLYDAQQYVFSIMNHLSFGLIAIDQNEEIHWVNDTACRTLNIRRSHLIEEKIIRIFPEWERLKPLIDKGETILDLEKYLKGKNKQEHFLINAYSITNEKEERIGYVVSFRPFSRMLKLLNKFSGPRLSFDFDKIIYKSKAMQNLIDYAKNIASTPSTVLITGESGTGKEVFAQAIHCASDRAEQGFIAINCGAISESLIESELFGYEEGAFTGALKGGKPGKFEIANKGTLFLDEIGEMPIDMQVKLLRVLQEKTFTRVGGSKTLSVDIRIIAATNKDLEEEVKRGNFRQDLYYRLSVIPLHIPPLRERKMDIPPLFHYFLSRKANKLDRPVPATNPVLVKKIVHYDWPGNIRELENFAEKAVILNGNIQALFPDSNEDPQDAEKNNFLNFSDPENLPDLDSLEEKIIRQYLEIHEYNVSQTADILGIGRNTLYQKMKKYNIEH